MSLRNEKRKYTERIEAEVKEAVVSMFADLFPNDRVIPIRASFVASSIVKLIDAKIAELEE
jgi:hypothetical protein